MPNGGAKYSPEDDRRLLSIFDEWQGRPGWVAAAAEALGRTPESIEHRKRRLKRVTPSIAASSSPGEEQTIESAIAARVTSLDELLVQSRTDLELWDVDRHVINKWEIGAKHPETGAILVEPLWQVKAWLKPIKGAALARIARELLEDIRSETGPRARVRYRSAPADDDTAHAWEVDLSDVHLNKLSWAAETGEDYDTDIAESDARDATRDLLTMAGPFPPEKIILPIGNDLSNIDNLIKATTSGTPQDSDTRYHRMFRRARGLTSWMIEQCARVAPVEVVIVPGNHDELTAWTIGQVLEAEYANDRRVSFQSGPMLRKYVHYGRNLIGFTHGCDEPHKNLPQIMAVEKADVWSQTSYREWHVGHFHKQKATQPIMVDDNIGVTVRIIRAMSRTDAWHFRKGYVGGTRGAEAFVWKRSGGLRAHLYHTAA